MSLVSGISALATRIALECKSLRAQSYTVDALGPISLGLSTLTRVADGVNLDTAGMTVLVINQGTPANNGVWAVATGAWTRVAGFDAADASAMVAGVVRVRRGTTYGGTRWVTNWRSTNVIGTDTPTFWQLEPAIAAGTGAQFWRGDKVWATLDKAAVGLSNVLNVAQEPAITAGTSSQFWRGDKTWQALTLSNLSDTVMHEPCRVVAKPYALGATGGGNTTLSGLVSIDGVLLVTDNRVLVVGQTSASANGIYLAKTGAWVRAADADTSAKIANAIVPVREGILGAGSLWSTNYQPGYTLGTDQMFWHFFVRDNEDMLQDTGWVNFTVGAGGGAFAGTGTVQYAQYRIVGQLVQVRMMRDVTTATTYGQYNYTNANITASGAVPAAARPGQTTNGAGRMDDSPINVVISTSGTISYTGGVPKSVAVGDNCDVTFVYFLG